MITVISEEDSYLLEQRFKRGAQTGDCFCQSVPELAKSLRNSFGRGERDRYIKGLEDSQTAIGDTKGALKITKAIGNDYAFHYAKK